MVSLTITSRKEEKEQLIDFIGMGLEVYQCSPSICVQVTEMVEEIYFNIVKNAFPLEHGLIKVSLNYIEEQKMVELSFTNCGFPYNPLINRVISLSDDNNSMRLDSRIVTVSRNCIDEANYVYQNYKNITTLKKYII